MTNRDLGEVPFSMFNETYGFSANFTVDFWIVEVRYKNSLMQLV